MSIVLLASIVALLVGIVPAVVRRRSARDARGNKRPWRAPGLPTVSSSVGRLLVGGLQAAVLAASFGVPRIAAAVDCDGAIEKRYFLRSQGKSWHSGWYDPTQGRPIALVVPPTAEFQSQYSWGVPSSRVMPLYHQFRRPYPGPGAAAGGSPFRPTPNIPSDTVQFGVNAVRGPW